MTGNELVEQGVYPRENNTSIALLKDFTKFDVVQAIRVLDDLSSVAQLAFQAAIGLFIQLLIKLAIAHRIYLYINGAQKLDRIFVHALHRRE